MSWRSVCFLFSFFIIFGRARPTSQSQPECRLEIHDWEYDICPIVLGPKRTVQYEYLTQAMSVKTVYEINLGGSRETDGNMLDSDQCPKGTWICMSVYERHRDNTEPRITTNVWGFFPVDSGLSANSDLEGGSLTPWFRFASNSHHPQQALVRFICDDNAQELTTPSLIEHHGGVHIFHWTTRHACGRSTANLALNPSSTHFTLLESPESEGEGEEGQDLRDTIPIPGSSRHSATTIIFLSGSVIMILGLIFYSSPESIRNFVDASAKPFRFRVGERRLVSWAEEDLILGGEEDIMVNSFNDQDEHIPLKLSPRKHFPTNYGSA